MDEDYDVMAEHANEEAVRLQLAALLKMLRANKPNDRSELDKVYAIAITDAMKMYAWWEFSFWGFPTFEDVGNA